MRRPGVRFVRMCAVHLSAQNASAVGGVRFVRSVYMTAQSAPLRTGPAVHWSVAENLVFNPNPRVNSYRPADSADSRQLAIGGCPGLPSRVTSKHQTRIKHTSDAYDSGTSNTSLVFRSDVLMCPGFRPRATLPGHPLGEDIPARQFRRFDANPNWRTPEARGPPRCSLRRRTPPIPEPPIY